MDIQAQIDEFLAGEPHAVVGASQDRNKYGNKVLRVYQQQNRPVYPVNPKADEVEGLTAYPDLASLPEAVHAVNGGRNSEPQSNGSTRRSKSSVYASLRSHA